MTKWRVKARVYVCAATVMLAGTWAIPSPAHADDLESVLPYVVENHDRIRAAKSRLSAARNRAREALGAWFPTLSQTANAGHEKQHNDNGPDTSTGFNEWDISLTQLLWDFGSTNASVDKARLQVEEARYSLIEARQSLILEAITAYVDVSRADAALQFARESEDNIRRQTGLEEALVDLGSGFSTDVLQAKTQLAGAQARQAQSQGALTTALNRYQAVFGRTPSAPDALVPVPFPASYVPSSLKQAIDVALEANPSLKNAILAADIAREDVRIAKADNFFPTIEGTAERKFKKNVGGTIGSEQETLAKVEMTFDFNLGMTAVNTLKASEEDLSATEFTAADTRRNIEEQVRNAWQQLQTAQQTAAHLANQANIAEAFLELARNERQLGRRSLIDVLSGETNLINARSDALSAETDVIVAAYGLLAATGQLEYELLSGSKNAPTPRYNVKAAPQSDAEIPSPPVIDLRTQTPVTADTNTAAARSAQDFNALMSALETDKPADAEAVGVDRWTNIAKSETPEVAHNEIASRDTSASLSSAPLLPATSDTDGNDLESSDLPAPEASETEVAVAVTEIESEVAALPPASSASPSGESTKQLETLSSAASSIFSFFQQAHEAKVAADARLSEKERHRQDRARERFSIEAAPEQPSAPEIASVDPTIALPTSGHKERQELSGLRHLFSDLLALFTPSHDSASGATASEVDRDKLPAPQPIAATLDEDDVTDEQMATSQALPQMAVIDQSDEAETEAQTGANPISALDDFFSAIFGVFKAPAVTTETAGSAASPIMAATSSEPNVIDDTHARNEKPLESPFALTADGAKLIAAIGNIFSRPDSKTDKPAVSAIQSDSVADD